MTNKERASLFLAALARQAECKSWMRDGMEGKADEPFKILASITEELGEVATDLIRERYYGCIVECVDMAHGALRLAIALDEDGTVLSALFRQRAGETG